MTTLTHKDFLRALELIENTEPVIFFVTSDDIEMDDIIKITVGEPAYILFHRLNIQAVAEGLRFRLVELPTRTMSIPNPYTKFKPLDFEFNQKEQDHGTDKFQTS